MDLRGPCSRIGKALGIDLARSPLFSPQGARPIDLQ